jgi:hypothetical protein
MNWMLTNRADPMAAQIADRHYTRQSVGSRQFVAPSRCIVLLVPDAPVLWVSSWPYAEYVRHAWAGAWMCTLFRNEASDRYLSSELVSQAVAVTRALWGKPPKQGFVTFVDASKVRQKRDPGRCFCLGLRTLHFVTEFVRFVRGLLFNLVEVVNGCIAVVLVSRLHIVHVCLFNKRGVLMVGLFAVLVVVIAFVLGLVFIWWLEIKSGL